MPEQPIVPDVTTERTSHSRMSTFFECSWKWWVKYRNADLVDEVPMWAGVGGSAFHNATEQIDKEELWKQ